MARSEEKRSVMQIGLAKGLDQSAPETLLGPDKLARARNCRVTKAGSLEPRPPFEAMALNTLTSTITPKECFCHDEQTLVLESRTIDAWHVGLQRWVVADRVPEATITRVIDGERGLIAASVGQYIAYDAIKATTVGGGAIVVTTWSYYVSSGVYRVCMRIIDVLTGARSEITSYTAAQPFVRLALVGLKVCVVYQTTTSVIVGRLLDTSAAPYSWGSPVTLASTLDTSAQRWEAKGTGGPLWLAFNSGRAAGTINRHDASLAVVATVNVSDGARSVWAVDASAGGGTCVWVAWDRIGVSADLYCEVFAYSDLTPIGGVTLELDAFVTPDATNLYVNRIGIAPWVSGLSARIVYGRVACATPATPAVVKTKDVSSTGTIGAATHTTYNVDLLSQPFWENQKLYAVLVHACDYWNTNAERLQSTAYLCELPAAGVGFDRGPAHVVSRVLPYRVGDPQWMHPVCAESFSSEYDQRCCAIPRAPEDPALGSADGFDVHVFGFGVFGSRRTKRYGAHTLMVGGVPMVWDGSRLVELGWHYYPTITGAEAATGALTLLGAYAWVAVYTWIDNQGCRHWSNPSEPKVITLTGTNRTANLVIAALTLTDREDEADDRFPVQIEIFRSLANAYSATGEIAYYYVDTVSNVRGSATVAYSDTASDATISAHRQVYTRGGVLATGCPPALADVEIHDGRPWGINAEDSRAIVFGHPSLAGEAPRMPDEYVYRAAQGKGYTAIGSIGERLLAFQDGRIDAIFGVGPNDAGMGQAYSDPHSVCEVIGCQDPRSLVRFASGFMFQAAGGGIWAIDDACQPSYVGAAIEDDLAACPVMVDALADHANARIIFVLRNGAFSDSRVLCWHYAYNVWTTIGFGLLGSTPIIPTDAMIAPRDGGASVLYMCTVDGTVIRENPALTGQDFATTTFDMILETAWLQPGGLQGIARSWRASVLGNCAAANAAPNVTVSIWKDYDLTTAPATHAWTHVQTSTLLVGTRVQLQPQFAVDEVQAVKLRVTMTPDAVHKDQRMMRIEAISLEVGTETGLMPLVAAARV